MYHPVDLGPIGEGYGEKLLQRELRKRLLKIQKV